MVGGLAVLAGWWVDSTLLTTVLPGWPSAKPNAALACMLAGISVYCLAKDAAESAPGLRRSGLVCALVIFVIAAATLAEYLGASAFDIDSLLRRNAIMPGEVAIPGRMTPTTAVGFTLLSGALALLHLRRATSFAQTMLVAVAALFTLSLISDVFVLSGAGYGQIRHTAFASVSLPAAFLFLVVTAGALHAPATGGFFRVATRADLGGQTIRRVFPWAVGLLFAAAQLSVWAQFREYVDAPLGAAWTVVAGALALGVILWHSARLLGQAEAALDALHANLEDMVLQRTGQLRERERQFSDLFEFAPDAMIMTNERGLITLANRQAETLFGWSRTELVGQPVEILMPRSAHAKHSRLREGYLQSAVPRAMASGRPDLRGVTKDGREFPVDISLSPIVSKAGAMVVAAVRDLTDRRRIEQALQDSEEKYRLLVEGASEIFYKVLTPGDPLRGELQFVSHGAARITGYDAEDFIRNPALWATLIHPDDLEQVAASTHAVMVGAAPGVRSYRIRDAEDTYHWIEDRVTPVTDARGKVGGYQGVARDVSERTRLEQQLRQSQKMDAIGQLAGGVAHDFNNLLTVISGMTEMAMAGLPEHGQPCQDLREVRQAADRATSLTRQLLAFSRRQMLKPEVIDLNAIVENLLTMLGRLIGEHIRLAFLPASDLGFIRVDPGQIEQVLMNLVINARDAMPAGGNLTIETENVVLDAAAAAAHILATPGPHVVMTVSDTGMGMDEATRAKIFEPFFTTKEKGKGTGLGLATVYGIVKQSLGSIWVYSEPDRGSSFKIYLPRVEPPTDATSIAPTVVMTRGTETILVVEDETALRHLAQRILEAAGYTVLAAASGNEALALLEEYRGPLDLVFTDVVMPGLGGRDLATAIRAHHPTTKVLYTSGYTADAIVHHGVLEEGTHFITKPYTNTTLKEAVRRVLDAG